MMTRRVSYLVLGLVATSATAQEARLKIVPAKTVLRYTIEIKSELQTETKRLINGEERTNRRGGGGGGPVKASQKLVFDEGPAGTGWRKYITAAAAVTRPGRDGEEDATSQIVAAVAGKKVFISTKGNRVVLKEGDADGEAIWLLPVLFAFWVALFLRARRDPARKQRQERRWLKLWIVGELIRKVETARFSRTLGTLLANGVTLIKAVEIARGTLANAAMNEALSGLRAALSKGEGLTRPLRLSAVFPPLALQLIEVGEESGNLDEMLLKVADIFDEEVDRGLERMVALLVPLVTITLGMLVAIIIASMISAILGSYGAAF